MSNGDFSYWASKTACNEVRKHLLEAFCLNDNNTLILHTRNIKEVTSEEPARQIYIFKKEQTAAEDKPLVTGFVEYTIRGECCKLGAFDIEDEAVAEICGILVFNTAAFKNCKKVEDFVRVQGSLRPQGNAPFEKFKQVLGFDSEMDVHNKYEVIFSQSKANQAIESYNNFVTTGCSRFVGEHIKKIRQNGQSPKMPLEKL